MKRGVGSATLVGLVSVRSKETSEVFKTSEVFGIKVVDMVARLLKQVIAMGEYKWICHNLLLV